MEQKGGRYDDGESTLGKPLGIGGGCGTAPPSSISTLSWNCRGPGNRRTIRALEKGVSSKDPNFIFLMETKLLVSEMDGIKDGLKRSQGLVIPSKGWDGGLALLWKEELKVDIQYYSDSHIDPIVGQCEDGLQWRLTSFYGNPETSKRGIMGFA